MSIGLVAQYAVIAVLVIASALHTLRKLAPTFAARRQAALAARLLEPGRSAFAQRIGRALQPHGATGNCSDGCSTCGVCGPKPADADAKADADASEKREQPVTFHRRRG